MTTQELIQKYDIVEVTYGPRKGMLQIRNDRKAIKDNAVDEIKARKPEILAYFAEQRKAEQEAKEARQAKINAIPGLLEIKKAIADTNAWKREFEASFEGEGGGGVGVRPKPKYDIDTMLAAHPHAAAYIKAYNQSIKQNLALREIGQKALERVIEGDYEQAITDMETEIKAFTERHFWD